MTSIRASVSALYLLVNAGLTFDSMDKPILEVVFDLLQNHYPERYKIRHTLCYVCSNYEMLPLASDSALASYSPLPT